MASLQLALFILICFISLGSGDSPPLAIAQQGEIGAGEALFTPPGYDPHTVPSLAFTSPLIQAGPMPDGWSIVPQFSVKDGKVSASISVPPGASLYGTGEVTGPLLRNGKTITLWNTDNFTYIKDGGHRLYQSDPWVLGVRPDGTSFGVIFDTTWKSALQTNSDRIVLTSQGPAFRVAIIERNSPQEVVRALAELTGKMPLPPKWALGFHQCRYSYYPDAKVREIADGFRKRDLPCDVIWMDIHYMDGYRIFTFDPSRFPDPKSTNDYLHKNGFHSVWMIDPGVKAESGYSVYDSGSLIHAWVEDKNGQDYHGEVWPGKCVFPDFTMPSVQQWWSNQYADFVAKGVDGVWNDMNEPSVFNTPDGTMPEDNVHRGGGDLPPGPSLMYHNVYGMLMTSATRKGIQNARPQSRPFILTRANYLGGQRYAATWTGDNDSAMKYLKTSIPMSLNLGLSGQPMSGPDIGGYAGAITPDLYGKWIAMEPFYPFSRAHTNMENPPREPWVFGKTIENVARTALDRRYRLMPYLYTLAYNSSMTGDPIMQPVFFADPKDLTLRDEDQAFLFGPDLLVIPRWADSPKLPKGIWRNISVVDEKLEQDGYQPTLKIRGGSIVPLGRIIQNTGEPSLVPLTLIVCLDETGHAKGSLYEDAGDGFGYTKGEYALTQYAASREGNAVTVHVENRQGNLSIPDREIRVKVMTDSGIVEGTGSDSHGVSVRL
jgi:alpha-glucosidase